MDTKALELLRYRMQSISIGHLAIRHVLIWQEVPPIKVYFGEDQVIEGLATAFTNPAIEAGLIHCRALLEFLGLASEDSRTLKQRRHPRKDDIVIETFTGPNGPLKKVEPGEALSPYKGTPQVAELALAYVLHTANKVIAHSTHAFSKEEEASRLIEIALRSVPSLMVNNFYNRMGIEAPNYKIEGRPRTS